MGFPCSQEEKCRSKEPLRPLKSPLNFKEPPGTPEPGPPHPISPDFLCTEENQGKASGGSDFKKSLNGDLGRGAQHTRRGRPLPIRRGGREASLGELREML